MADGFVESLPKEKRLVDTKPNGVSSTDRFTYRGSFEKSACPVRPSLVAARLATLRDDTWNRKTASTTIGDNPPRRSIVVIREVVTSAASFSSLWAQLPVDCCQLL
jgi:hypothetical protein